MNEITYQDALKQIQTLWNAGAGAPSHPNHHEFHTLYEEITAFEVESGIASATQPTFQIDSLEKLEWYVSKKADLQSRKVRLEAQYKAMLKDIERDEERLDWRFSQQAETLLRQELGEKKRSLKFLGGTAGLRRVPGRVSIEDEALLIRSLQEVGGPLSSAVVTTVDTKVLNQLVKVNGDQAFQTDTGCQVEFKGLSIKSEREVFYVKAGKEE